ncbi:MAG: bifunctional oligoribonuclease/PAP phosphatase NrnA [Eubacteriales bacterium]|nr:bifunctional oligoribonuclease/PAP phosphatase NrnA [Eubacteriales bacterium]
MRKISEELNGVKTVGIAGHIRPDGDCVGSCMALRLYLEENFSQLQAVDVYLEEIPKSYHILQGTDRILTECGQDREYDLFIALDCGDMQRLGQAEKYFRSAKRTICYDHHISNTGYADENYIFADASSTAEVIYHVMEPEKISKAVAEAIYMGLVHDTGIFQYSCTSPETLEIAAELLRKGVNGGYITDTTFMEKTYVQNQILGRALLESILALDGTCIISAVKRKVMEFYGVKPADLEGIVGQLRLTKGVETALFLYELSNQEYKVSMRSKSIVDVSAIASYFGGGGHVRAAGCVMQGSYHDVINNLTKHIEKQMKAAREKEEQAKAAQE